LGIPIVGQEIKSENKRVESPSNSHAEPRLSWLFLDLNSYFASVEQELCPELRGLPVAVVPVVAETTCCIAASYEAKAYGVRTGTQVAEARRMCPGIQFLEARHEIYVDYHNRIVDAVETCLPVAAVMSIDEMACRLMGREQPLLAALELGRRVKAAIREQVGSTLRCSVGLATNRYLAKIASDMEKPDGMVALTPDIREAALRGLTLRDLPGVGARMEKRLHECGIRTMDQLLSLDRQGMNDVWGGINGEKLWHWLQGEDFLDPELDHNKSIGNSHVLSPELRTEEGAWAVAHKLLHKAAMRLRMARLWTSHLSLTLRFAVPRQVAGSEHNSGIPQAVWSHGISLVECQDNQTLVEALGKLWAQSPKGEHAKKPFFVGVQFGNLVPDHLHTLNLFSQLESEVRKSRLTVTMDSLNRKYGTETITSASSLLARAAAPTRIAFTSIPDLF
jgi:DNA polymerase-4